MAAPTTHLVGVAALQPAGCVHWGCMLDLRRWGAPHPTGYAAKICAQIAVVSLQYLWIVALRPQ